MEKKLVSCNSYKASDSISKLLNKNSIKDLSFSELILVWYDQNARDLPWREKNPNPYKVWLSEIMLQQTTVFTVTPYFLKFIGKFKTIQDLAQASESEVLWMWQGLGYYSRARNLLKCAIRLSETGFPNTPSEWLSFPGIGPYTAAAVCAIAFEYPILAVDGNIRRVMSRIHAQDNLDFSDPDVSMLPNTRFGDYNQAIMDLGSSICKPKNPKCDICPVQKKCRAFSLQAVASFPKKKKALEKKKQDFYVFILKKKDFVFVHSQSKNFLLKGLYGFPMISFNQNPESSSVFSDFVKKECEFLGKINHIFTHISMTAHVYFFDLDHSFEKQEEFQKIFEIGEWVLWSHLSQYPFSKLMRKVEALALNCF